jgi:hypothetical protein
MKFKELTKVQIKEITDIYTSKDISWDIKEKALADYIGKSTRTARGWCSKLGLTKPTEVASPQYEDARKKKVNKKKKVYLITSAQSNTSINDEMLDSMELYAEKHNAEILITPLKYSVDMSFNKSHTWAKRTIPYLNANRQDLCKTLSYCGDVKILPTGKWPLSSLSPLTGLNSAIYGSPKIHQESHPTLQGDSAKILATTGSLTKGNYTDSKQGKHGEHYHQFGFVVVEIQDNKIFHLRQVEVNKDGSFDDLYFHVENGEITRNTEIEGIVIGDVHFATVDEVALDTTFKLMDELTPKHVVLEDVFDGQSVNPHNLDDPFYQAKLEYMGKNDLEEELDDMMEKLGRFEKFENVVIVRSNHDLFLERFLKRDWRKLPTMKNSLVYMDLSAMIIRTYKAGKHFKGVIPTLITEKFPKYHALDYDEPYYIKHFAVFNHGEKGSNGSRGGGAKNWSKFTSGVDGHRERGVITAHTHTPSRYGNSICVGHMLLPQDYTIGSPSSWIQSNAIVYKSGKAQQIHIIDGIYYTTFK